MKKMRILLVLCLLVGCQREAQDTLQVGVIQFGDFASLNDALEGLEHVLENEDINLVVKSAQGDAANIVPIAIELVDMEVDVIVAITTQAAQAAIGASEGKIPVIFVAVSDPEAAGVTGFDYVTGVSDAAPLDVQFELIQALTPDIKRIGVLHKIGDPNGIYQTEQIKAVGESLGYIVETEGAVEVSDLSLVAQRLAEKVDAFYLITDGLIVGHTGLIVETARRNGICSYASEDGQMAHGVLATHSISYAAIGEQAAVLVLKVLKDGVNPSDIEIEYPSVTVPMINGNVAEAFDISIPENLQDYVINLH
ncbi:MAG TPA: ABC transporter substrate-binding protein [Erysipelothrix sp.]|nr:ABC transporter substrate-binding protein [Erysipelothrix sp.]